MPQQQNAPWRPYQYDASSTSVYVPPSNINLFPSQMSISLAHRYRTVAPRPMVIAQSQLQIEPPSSNVVGPVSKYQTYNGAQLQNLPVPYNTHKLSATKLNLTPYVNKKPSAGTTGLMHYNHLQDNNMELLKMVIATTFPLPLALVPTSTSAQPTMVTPQYESSGETFPLENNYVKSPPIFGIPPPSHLTRPSAFAALPLVAAQYS